MFSLRQVPNPTGSGELHFESSDGFLWLGFEVDSTIEAMPPTKSRATKYGRTFYWDNIPSSRRLAMEAAGVVR